MIMTMIMIMIMINQSKSIPLIVLFIYHLLFIHHSLFIRVYFLPSTPNDEQTAPADHEFAAKYLPSPHPGDFLHAGK